LIEFAPPLQLNRYADNPRVEPLSCKMRSYRLLLTVSFLTFISAATLAGRQHRDELSPDIEPKLRAVLPFGWSITRGPDSITLARDVEVFIYSSLNWPAFIDKSMDEMVREYGHEVVYSLTLRFVPRLRRTEYVALKRQYDACQLENKPGPTFSIEKWERAQECYRARQPPVYYTNRYTIYVDQPDWWSELKIYPKAAATESERVHRSLDKLFSRYEKPHQ